MPKRKDIKKILVIGAGPIIIGYPEVGLPPVSTVQKYWFIF